MIRGVIIEGLSTSGKTSVLSALKGVQSQTLSIERTMIAVSEHYSQVLHQDHGVLRSLNQEEHIELLNGHVHYLEQLYNWIDSCSVAETCQKFLNAQDRLRQCAEQSLIPTMEIRTDDEDWDSYARQIMLKLAE